MAADFFRIKVGDGKVSLIGELGIEGVLLLLLSCASPTTTMGTLRNPSLSTLTEFLRVRDDDDLVAEVVDEDDVLATDEVDLVSTEDDLPFLLLSTESFLAELSTEDERPLVILPFL